MNTKDFLQSLYGENACEVYYRYHYSAPYAAIKLNDAAIMLQNDIDDFAEYLYENMDIDYNDAHDKARQYAYKLWKNEKLLVKEV